MTSKSRNFNDLSPFKKDLNQSESAADDPAVSKKSVDLMGVSVGGDIEIFWDPPDEEVANASSNKIG
jgi:hypothetical protein